MERYSMFLGKKNQYFENNYTIKHYLQIQCNPYQITNGIFHKTRTKNHSSYGNTKDLKPRQSWERRMEPEKSTFLTQTILQSYSHQDCMVLAQKQKYRSMVQDRRPRDKPTHLWSPNLWQERQEHIVEKRQSLPRVVLGKLDSYM